MGHAVTQGVYPIDSSVGMGQKYNTCLHNLAPVLEAWEREFRKVLPGFATTNDGGQLGFNVLSGIHLEKYSRTKHSLSLYWLGVDDLSRFVYMPWGLTHLDSGWVVCGEVPRQDNVCLFNLIAFYLMAAKRFEARGSRAGLDVVELAGLCEAYKLGHINPIDLAIDLLYGSPREGGASADQSLLAMLVLGEEPGVDPGYTPPDDSMTCSEAMMYFEGACRMGTLPALREVPDLFEVTPSEAFPVAPAAEQVKFAQGSAQAKAAVDALLDHLRVSQENIPNLRNIRAFRSMGITTFSESVRALSSRVGLSTVEDVLYKVSADIMDLAAGRGEVDGVVLDSFQSLAGYKGDLLPVFNEPEWADLVGTMAAGFADSGSRSQWQLLQRDKGTRGGLAERGSALDRGLEPAYRRYSQWFEHAARALVG